MATFPGASLDTASGLTMPPGISLAPGFVGAEAQPPGLWQTPDITGIGSAASSRGALDENREHDVQTEITNTTENQVQRLIDSARQTTESKVKAELKQLVDAMRVMDGRLDQMLATLEREPAKAPESALDSEQVGAILAKIEQHWGQEIRTLKQELHQTILAHNHNADLIKHHKDTIDSMQEKCTKLKNNNVKSAEFQQQIQRLTGSLKQQQKQKKLEPLFERIVALEQQVVSAQQVAYRGYPGIPPMMPPGALSGVAPGMLPPGVGPSNVGKGMSGAPGATKPAAYRRPTDEEVHAQLSKLAQSGNTDTEFIEESIEVAEDKA